MTKRGMVQSGLIARTTIGLLSAAMLIVMVTIAILSALAVDLAYETRVRLQIAANGRDELRAEALAKSAVNLSRLVLGFQQQVDQAGADEHPWADVAVRCVRAHRLRYDSTSPTAATVWHGRSSGDDARWSDIAYSDVVRVGCPLRTPL